MVPLAVENFILELRGQKVILDADLARLYGVSTKALNQAVKRNAMRFPHDFILQLLPEEMKELVTNCDRFKNLKHSTTLPRAFSEHGAVMAATVLNSSRAILVSIYVVRAFVHLRSMAVSHKEVMMKLNELEERIETHDNAIVSLFDAIRKLMTPLPAEKRKIGFRRND